MRGLVWMWSCCCVVASFCDYMIRLPDSLGKFVYWSWWRLTNFRVLCNIQPYLDMENTSPLGW